MNRSPGCHSEVSDLVSKQLNPSGKDCVVAIVPISTDYACSNLGIDMERNQGQKA